MGKEAFEEKVAAIQALRSDPRNALEPLRKALKDRNNFLCSKAAAVAADLCRRELIPDLLTAFERFLKDAVKTDAKCWAKEAIVKALKDLDHQDPEIYLRGLAHVQMEPGWGPPVDAAAALRGACALALVACAMPRHQILLHLAEALADKEMRVRIDAARAIAQLPGDDTVLMLRVKALAGDEEPPVTGQCFLSLLGIDPRPSIPFVARFLTSPEDGLRFEAAAALGECLEVAAVEALIARWELERSPEMKQAIELSLGVSRLKEAKDFLEALAEKRIRNRSC